MGTFRIGTLMVGGLLGATEAGLYRIAANVAEIGSKAGKLFNPAFYPELARLIADNNLVRLRQLLTRSIFLASLASVLFLALIWLAGTPLLRLIGGEETTQAYQTLVLLTAAQLVVMAVFPIEPTLISVGKPLAALWSRLIMAAVYLPSLPLFVIWQGLEGAALALVVGHSILVVAQLAQLQWWFTKHHRN
jgi:O-antigen/teichoic acid export membrane protein